MLSKSMILIVASAIMLTANVSLASHSVQFDAEGLTPLHRAAGRGDAEAVRALLDAGYPLVLDLKMGVSVLHKAVYSGDPVTVRAVLENGGGHLINLSSPSNGNTPLHDAIYFRGRDWSVLRVLVDHGANPRLLNRAGKSPMVAAAELFRDPEPLDIMSHGERRLHALAHSKLMESVRSNDVAAVRRFLAQEPTVDLSGSDEQGFTPVIWAAREGFSEIVTELLDHGAEINQVDEWMRANAGHKAAFWGRTEVMRILIGRGLDLNARGGYNGYTALHDAIVRGHDAVAALLLDAGADCLVAGHDGKTPRSIAQEKQNWAVINHSRCR